LGVHRSLQTPNMTPLIVLVQLIRSVWLTIQRCDEEFRAALTREIGDMQFCSERKKLTHPVN